MKSLFTILLVAITATVSAQAYETTVKVQKVEQPALAITYNYPPDIMEKALQARLNDLKLKSKTSKGVRTVNGVIAAISENEMNYTFTIDKKSKKEKNTSVVYMVVSGANLLNVSSVDVKNNAKKFLADFQPYIDATNLEASIKEQEDLLGKAEKKLKSLESDEKDLEKKIKKAESDLSDNRKEQSKQSTEIDTIKRRIEDLKNKRY